MQHPRLKGVPEFREQGRLASVTGSGLASVPPVGRRSPTTP
jgi:hypothetical protein